MTTVMKNGTILAHDPKKGVIAVGSDADIVTREPKEKTITAAKHRSAIEYTAFQSQHVKGLPRFTLIRGKVVVHEGEIRTQEGGGEFVKRAADGPVNRAFSFWKELTTPRPVERTGIHATGA